MDDGFLKGITPKGDFSIRLMKLNRPPLITLRIHKKKLQDDRELMEQIVEISRVLKQANDQINTLISRQHQLLEEQLFLLRLLTRKDS